MNYVFDFKKLLTSKKRRKRQKTDLINGEYENDENNFNEIDTTFNGCV